MHRFYITITAFALALTLHLGAAATLPAAPVYAECDTSPEGRNVDATYFAEMLMMLQQKPHPFAVKALMDWKPMEGTRACWNPLSTTMETANSDNFNCLNPPDCTMGVQDFPNKVKGQQFHQNERRIPILPLVRSIAATYVIPGDPAIRTT